MSGKARNGRASMLPRGQGRGHRISRGGGGTVAKVARFGGGSVRPVCYYTTHAALGSESPSPTAFRRVWGFRRSPTRLRPVPSHRPADPTRHRTGVLEVGRRAAGRPAEAAVG